MKTSPAATAQKASLALLQILPIFFSAIHRAWICCTFNVQALDEEEEKFTPPPPFHSDILKPKLCGECMEQYRVQQFKGNPVQINLSGWTHYEPIQDIVWAGSSIFLTLIKVSLTYLFNCITIHHNEAQLMIIISVMKNHPHPNHPAFLIQGLHDFCNLTLLLEAPSHPRHLHLHPHFELLLLSKDVSYILIIFLLS